VVLVLCIAGLSAVATQVRCVDAAREAARLVARGDRSSAEAAVRDVGPAGAELRLRAEGGHVIARVSASAPVLPGVVIAAEAVAAVEPDSG
jgi:hypothetical protein